MSSSISYERLRAYVLGQLDEAGREEVDLAYLTDDSVFAEIQAAETEVVRDYVAGELSNEETIAFSRYLEANPAIEERVLIARVLRRVASQAQPERFERAFGWLRGWHVAPAAAMGLVAFAVVAVAVGWWQARALGERLSASLADQQRLTEQVSVLSARAVPQPVPILVESGLNRNSARPRVQLPSPPAPVKLQAALLAAPGGARYRLRVESTEGMILASGESDRAEIVLPAGILQPRKEYVVRIERIEAAGGRVELPSAYLGTAAP